MKPHPTKHKTENVEVLLEVLLVHNVSAVRSVWNKGEEAGEENLRNVSFCFFICAATLQCASVTHDCTFFQAGLFIAHTVVFM